MGLDNGGVVKPSIAHIMLAAVDTVAPTAAAIDGLSATAPVLAGWTNFGHTSLANDFSPFLEGGESTVEGSRQLAKLRETVAATTEGLVVSSMQTTSEILQLTYGGGTTPSAGRFVIPSTSTPIERAALIVYFDGNVIVAEYHSKSSIRRDGAIRNAASGWLEFPIRMTWLQGANADEWIGETIDVLV
ncbi:Phage tail fibers [Alloactinosynnema sp. L-07]|uniref:phage tail tube protein n=1 Tax=Alloactinosynnema sp. L-07 TaxID=1653480 RepID=UPI00065EFA12|nr:hypothetical protein [Alloactinosynnema sp. L-07]CRK59075.1 Phage tail fibers [Alloactinosynnema sp. L-07]